MAKYLCLTQANYVYFDSDIRVLEDFRTDKELYSEAELQSVSEKYRETCLVYCHHEQPGINLLVSLTNVEATNPSLPPNNMESTMAVDGGYLEQGSPHK
jgi:hypothetical protein